ncbi:malonic semialdehyde reductase [Galbitalea soli]|uniref:Malonic semialdehyde reductase n=1 Tax=Galbitalea soli TaxID=1268042 RepID=A0A7C9PNT0_9MICO|nr:malonic semialdehyde reductase [Galbitalea soli]NEM91628.1 malonic semialdehyde reductase [Galbitalea soli]NYJ30322.1 3-hydroxypropanoate dehydrogenase [Galbitalea soli]
MTSLASSAQLDPVDESARAALFTDAHTANAFADIPVSDEQLREIWSLAKWAPTQANFQPLRVLYVQSPEARERLVAQMSEGNRAKTLAAPAVAVLAFDGSFHQHIPTVVPHLAHMKDSLEQNLENRVLTARNNAWLQAGYFIVAVRAAGFAAGPMGGFDAAGVDREFFADSEWGSFLVVNIGYPAEDAYRPRLPRLDEEHVLAFA